MRRHFIAAVCLSLIAASPACARHEARVEPAHSVASSGTRRAALVLADGGRARVVIVAPERLAPEPAAAAGEGRKKKPRKPRPTAADKAARAEQARLLASVADLAHYLERLSGAAVEVAYGKPPSGDRVPIWIGELGQQQFGPVGASAPGQQGLRVVVRASAIGLYGESDLATSYAIYEMLDRLGCRWFMPGALGEDIPSRSHLELPLADDSLAPATSYRSIWYADDDYKRRNRLGGLRLAAGHKLETWITDEQRQSHPDWRATVRGAPSAKRLRWSNPEVADAIAEAMVTQLEKKPAVSLSLSPGDGMDFDEDRDRALDAGDWDPSVNRVSLTDRLLVLANRVAEKVATEQPDVLLGLLAYASYTRPPVREKVHPNVVPVIAPITYCRTRAWSDPACPGGSDVRRIVDGWSERARHLAYRGYVFNLSEPAAPNPLMRKQSADLPYLLSRHLAFYQPETLPTFEVNLPALYLGVRLAWDAKRSPQAVLSELFGRFYGHAGGAVRKYLEWVDAAWVDTKEFSGGHLGYSQRFPEAFSMQARTLLEAAKLACQTPSERERVALLDDSLGQFELYLLNERNFRSGKLDTLGADYERWLARASELAERYGPNSAFGKAKWAGQAGVYAYYAERFVGPAYREAARVWREEQLLLPKPLCSFDYRLMPDATPPLPAPPEVSGAHTDVCHQTWSTLGQDDYFGSMAYATTLDLPTVPQGQRVSLWLSSVDGVAQVWLNGQAAPPVADPAAKTAEAHLKSLTFDVTAAQRPGQSNQLVVVVRRTRLAELGAGGLLGPLYLYRSR